MQQTEINPFSRGIQELFFVNFEIDSIMLMQKQKKWYSRGVVGCSKDETNYITELVKYNL
jgi:hypothetical protein